MTPSLALTIAVLILVFALGLPTITRTLRARRYAREARRFARDPRVGDKAGYRLTDTQWAVGVVIIANGVACLETERVTAIGTVKSTGGRDINTLRWFPPYTPLGIVTLDSTEVGE